jgi:poly-gamma-glutamate capsule biosynthesis protein CapA/YwtB (metallophosphatase superfamily)/fucose 4-O-acetylase-like acetyltransferase/lysophospholipase L1-like esterase
VDWLNAMNAISTDTRRIPYWDNLKGILIILVVLGHYLWEYQGYAGIRDATFAIYLFHMPAFVFVSGYFSRGERCRSGEALAEIFVYFMFLNFSMMFYAYYAAGYPFSAVHLYYSSWYLLALFLYRWTLPFFEKIRWIVPLSVGVSLSVGFVRGIDHIWLLQKIISLYPFFIVGATLSTERMDRIIADLKKRLWMLWIAMAVVASASLWLILTNQVGYRQVMWESYQFPNDLMRRVLVGLIAALMIVILLGITPRRYVPFVNDWGKNSLSIYVTHRIFTLLLARCFPSLPGRPFGMSLILAACFVTLLLLGSRWVTEWVHRGLKFLADMVLRPTDLLRVHSKGTAVVFVAGFLAGAVAMRDLPGPWLSVLAFADYVKASLDSPRPNAQAYSSVLTAKQAATIRNAVSVSFVGDLILLRDQVCNAYDRATNRYDFDPLFEYTKPYLSAADLSIGVFEGPMAGSAVEYSTSTYNDGIPLYLNFPDAFAEGVKHAGIDLVSTATNHVLDRGLSGARRTLDVLDRVGLAHVGSYRNEKEKNERDILIVNVQGLKIAVLAYTYGSNRNAGELSSDGPNAYLTSILADPADPQFEISKQAVLDDFKKARAKHPDAIIVLPHMGSQFSHTPDTFQKTWVDIFVRAGADIVFADHPHSVQPIEWRPTGRDQRQYALVVYCPGNYVNSFIEDDGDAMAIVEAYLDRKTGAPVAASIVPMWGQSTMNGMFRALPIDDILHHPRLQKEISTHDLARVKEVQAIVTSTMLGRDVPLDQAQRKYYLFPNGYVRCPVRPIEISESMKSSPLYQLLAKSHSVCFVGDSVTEGTRNGGYGWYEPLTAAFPELTVHRRAWGGCTAKTLLEKKNEIAGVPADIYVIAIGTNDVRYRDPRRCSMTSGEYIRNLAKLVEAIRNKHGEAQFVLIAPWTTDHHDPISALGEKQRIEMLSQYGTALQAYADEHHFLYIHPNPGIESVLRVEYPRKFLVDHIHPNADEGIRLYSTKVLEASGEGR